MAEGEMSWLPKNVNDKACDHPKQSKSGLKPHRRPRKATNWAAGGPGMQAIFLDSGHKSCGTGVFLPRRQDTDFQSCQKPACSLVLLPSRVVHALNLNVHELGLQIKPYKDVNNKSDGNLVGNKKSNDASTQCYVVSQNHSSSPEIFLPKEWTY